MFSLGWIDAAILCVIPQHLEELRGHERLIFLDPDVGYGSKAEQLKVSISCPSCVQ
jgi:hypothetical protein